MNVFNIAGIFLIAGGTLLIALGAIPAMASNAILLIVVGAGLNLLGLLSSTYGSYRRNRLENEATSQQIEVKIGEVLAEIDAIKQSPAQQENSEEGKSELERIEHDFTQWATEFLKNKEVRKLDFQKRKVERQIAIHEKNAQLNQEWRDFYVYALEVIKALASSYNQAAGSSIEYEIPAFPRSIFAEEEFPYRAEIKFGSELSWAIHVVHRHWRHLPDLIIEFCQNGEELSSISMWSGGYGNTITVLHDGSLAEEISSFRNEFSLESYKDVLKESLSQLFENYLLITEGVR